MKFLFFNWKDIKNPKAGGAEILTHEIMKSLRQENHQVTLITSKFHNSPKREKIDSIEIIRLGEGILHYPFALIYYLKNRRDEFDYIIEEINTIPYFISFFKGKEKYYLYYNQLCKEVWFYQMLFPFSYLGYFLEIIYTRILALGKPKVITISDSSHEDLVKYGFEAKKIETIECSLPQNNSVLKKINCLPKKDDFTVLFHSSLRPMKRPLEAVKGFHEFLKSLKEDKFSSHRPKFWLSGDGKEKDRCSQYILKNNLQEYVKIFGRVSEEEKLKLMREASILVSTSVKEGWGLIVSEANMVGTPAVVYDVDGLRDSARFGQHNKISPANPNDLAQTILQSYKLFYQKRERYNQISYDLTKKSSELTTVKTYETFKKILEYE
jgi:glycosyltransferase involved in cell wall biosynthesis